MLLCPSYCKCKKMLRARFGRQSLSLKHEVGDLGRIGRMQSSTSNTKITTSVNFMVVLLLC